MPVNFPNATCDGQFKCTWDSVAAFLEARTYKKDVHDICFNHLNYGNDIIEIDGNMPWWLAIIIAVPLVIISVIIIKCILKIRQRKKRMAAKS